MLRISLLECLDKRMFKQWKAIIQVIIDYHQVMKCNQFTIKLYQKVFGHKQLC